MQGAIGIKIFQLSVQLTLLKVGPGRQLPVLVKPLVQTLHLGTIIVQHIVFFLQDSLRGVIVCLYEGGLGLGKSIRSTTQDIAKCDY